MNSAPVAPYRVSSNKASGPDEALPCVVAADGEGGGLSLATLRFGHRGTHNVWSDGEEWLEKPTWRRAVEAGQLCAVVATSFVEGITCRPKEGPVLFLAALRVGDAFVLLTTEARRVSLLAARAEKQAQYAPTRSPLWMAASDAARWCAEVRGAEAAAAQTRTIEAKVQRNEPAMVLGAASDRGRRRRSDTPSKMLLAFVQGESPRKAPRLEPAEDAAVAQLVEMGFEAEPAAQALERAAGDVEAAAMALLSS